MGLSRRVVTTVAWTAVAAVGVRAAHHAQLSWGATPDECDAALPGDEVAASARLTATRAVTIGAPPAAVWPWVVQVGQGRGGFYSYEVLENLLGCDIHNAETVVDEWQALAVGDEVRLHPQAALTVAVVEPGEALVLLGPPAPPSTGARVTQPGTAATAPMTFTWAFVLRPLADGRTRLLVRERYAYEGAATGAAVATLSWLSFVMSVRMLGGIRRRAEALAVSGPT